tara:strand:- start:2599 stop:3438 length:840 start_codon:yes stop_codon:yes gene_type:complete
MKVVIFAIHFGPKIAWMDIFLKSCQYNPNINWVIFTDTIYKTTIPNNVKIEFMRLDMFIELANNKLGTDIVNMEPYKVCDFRPSFGILFDNYISEYDFWGHCDLDIIFGDIEACTLDHLPELDILSSRGGFKKNGRRSVPKMCGGLSLYRNSDLVNKLFYKSNFNHIFSSKKHFAFDEHGISNIIRQNIKLRTKWDIYFFNYPHETVIKRWWFCTDNHPGTVNNDHIWVWVSGKLYFRGREVGYLHFQDWKRIESFNRTIPSADHVDKIYISRFGICLR